MGDDQATIWNGAAGQAWVELQDALDRMFKPIETCLADAVEAGGGRQVLDVGCGAGGTTLAVARRLGGTGRVLGIDLSAPLLEAARARAVVEGVSARFIQADAATHAFEAGHFDTIISRFGVMFFDDPVRAFANLHRAAAASARLHCLAWRAPAENPFMTAAMRAAAPWLPAQAAPPPEAPGQFAFADPARVRDILEGGGWRRCEIEAVDVSCTFPETALLPYVTRMGPLGRLFPALDPERRSRVIDALRDAFESYVHGDEVRFVAACWQLRAGPSS